MGTQDLKESIHLMGGVQYKATENFEGGTVTVRGNKTDGYKVWVEVGTRTTCINPKNSKGEMGNYVNPETAIAKANYFIKLKSKTK